MEFKPGFRISIIDVMFIILGFFLSFWLHSFNTGLSIMVILPVIAFFCFCNVFRVRRIPELLWAGMFILACIGGQYYEHVILVPAICAFMGVAIIVACEMKHPSYHGIFWKKVNPGLESWLVKSENQSLKDKM